MQYLKLYQEKMESDKLIKNLKSLPYKDFMNSMIEGLKSGSLKSTLNDLKGDFISNKISQYSLDGYGSIKFKKIAAKKLFPTQSQIGLTETLSWLSNKSAIGEIIKDNNASLFSSNRIFTANGKWILDGNHRWAFVYMLNPDAEIPCIDIQLTDQKPIDMIKDLQISIASTYGKIWTRPSKVEFDLSKMDDRSIYSSIKSNIPSSSLNVLKDSYGQVDFSKFILRNVIPQSVYEASGPLPNDYVEFSDNAQTQDDPGFQELDETDNDNKEVGNIMNTTADYAGIFDVTGTIDFLNGVSYLYQGEYFCAIMSFISIIPVGDLIAKPLIGIAKSKATQFIVRKFTKYMKSFDVRKAAEVWMDLEKMSPAFGKFLDGVLSVLDKVKAALEKVLQKVGDNWLKFKIFYHLFASKIFNFFNELVNWKQKLKNYLYLAKEDDVYAVLASNASKIKGIIVDKGIDKMGVNFSMGPHPIQSSTLAQINPYGGKFKGVPELLLNNLPQITSKLKVKPKKEETQKIEEPEKIQAQKEVQPEVKSIQQDQPKVDSSEAPLSMGQPKSGQITKSDTSKPTLPTSKVDSTVNKPQMAQSPRKL